MQNNPFSASFTVKLESPEYASAVSEGIKDFEGVETIGDQQELVDKIVGIVNGVKVVGFGLFIILVGVSNILNNEYYKTNCIFKKKRSWNYEICRGY